MYSKDNFCHVTRASFKGTTKSIVQLNSMDFKLERYIITGISRSKETQEIYKLLMKRSGLTIFAGFSRLAGLPFTIGSDVKSLGLLLGTSVQARFPCPVCVTPKSVKVDSDGKHSITNFDDWFSLEPFAHKSRKVTDWTDQKLTKELKLKQLNPSIQEVFAEFEEDRIDQLVSFAPLHFKVEVEYNYLFLASF